MRSFVSALALSLTLLVGVAVAAAGAASSSSFTAARSQWLHSQCVDSADQSGVWLRAAAELARGAQSPATRRAELALRNLAALPETSETHAQMHQARVDIREIDAALRTPGAFGKHVPRCSG